MRICAFKDKTGLAAALYEKNVIVPLNVADSWEETIAILHSNRNFIPEKSQQPLQNEAAIPATDKTKIICVGLNYMDHALEGKQEVPKYPVYFIRYLSSFVADGENLILPKVSAKFDYEAELTIVIGRSGRYISKETALDHVFGYTIGMDGSIRDYQKRTPQWTLGKNFDRTGALGPVIVSADELPEGAQGLKVQSRLNGQLLQDGNSTDMIFDVATLVSTLSESITLNPGDLILTGTPSGVGFARTPPIFMKPGDEIEIEIEKIGKLKNKIVAEI